MRLCNDWPDITFCLTLIFPCFFPDRPDCVGGRLCFEFYSSLKNLKEVYICSAQGQKGPVRGQVSHRPPPPHHHHHHALYLTRKAHFFKLTGLHANIVYKKKTDFSQYK